MVINDNAPKRYGSVRMRILRRGLTFFSGNSPVACNKKNPLDTIKSLEYNRVSVIDFLSSKAFILISLLFVSISSTKSSVCILSMTSSSGMAWFKVLRLFFSSIGIILSMKPSM